MTKFISGRNIAAFALLIFISIFSFFLYKYTIAPGVIWGDSAKLTIFAYENNPRWDDAVGGHPAHTIASAFFSKFIGGENYAYKINLFSALCGSLSIFSVMIIVFISCKKIYSSIAAGCALMVSHTFWSYSVVAESYTMITFVALLDILLILLAIKTKKYLILFISGCILALSIMVNSLLIVSSIGMYYIIIKFFQKKALKYL